LKLQISDCGQGACGDKNENAKTEAEGSRGAAHHGFRPKDMCSGESVRVKNWRGTAFNVLMTAFVVYLVPFVLIELDYLLSGDKFYQHFSPWFLKGIVLFYAPVIELINLVCR
jgi:hypothetical protein